MSSSVSAPHAGAVTAGIEVISAEKQAELIREYDAESNFRKLGGVSNEYRVNFYGETTSSFLHNLGTDRLWITWLLDAERKPTAKGETIQIPRNIDALTTVEQWTRRQATRARFQQLLADGYCVTDYDGNGTYTLERGAPKDFYQ